MFFINLFNIYIEHILDPCAPLIDGKLHILPSIKGAHGSKISQRVQRLLRKPWIRHCSELKGTLLYISGPLCKCVNGTQGNGTWCDAILPKAVEKQPLERVCRKTFIKLLFFFFKFCN